MSELITPVENTPHSPTDGNEENKKRVRGSKSKLRTRCYYTDYVNHAIRFYLSTPESLQLDGKKRADIENWMAVQAVFHCLKDDDRAMIEEIYRSHYRVVEGVKIYCASHNADDRKVWIIITKTSAAIAKRRGLI